MGEAQTTGTDPDHVTTGPLHVRDHVNLKEYNLYYTRELPGVALVNISTGQIFMGILNYIDILK